ncbi:flagellar hook assembly protein FlgD [Filobacillus milosensis]|uniref:Flagellar hook assembly protein FlgD n=1 Tax=Filobacillus milosensis TaxID=94137 RepID=A0A4Y8IP05_9BACI|nr:flagellar hook assembly protein FlgD [Filobacillus milosensis]TFB23209.1 flagellar hook assembly protein FlgD [Filobacillus milosensis]
MKVDSSLYLSNQNQMREGNSKMDKDAFLKILMTQLTNQDPMDPMKDKDFVAQMASFSQLEQISNMSSNFEKLFNQQNQSNFLQYSNLIGNQVSYIVEQNGESNNAQSEVTSVKREGQDIFLTLNNGDVVNANNVYQVNLSQSDKEVTGNEQQD